METTTNPVPNGPVEEMIEWIDETPDAPLEGRRALEYAELLLERVPEGDALYIVAQTASAIMGALAPDVIGMDRGNVFARRIAESRKANPGRFPYTSW